MNTTAPAVLEIARTIIGIVPPKAQGITLIVTGVIVIGIGCHILTKS